MRRARHAGTLRLLSFLLDYPDPRLDAALEGSPEAAGPALAPFRDWWLSTSLDERRRRYVETFDLDRRTSLHLTYYLHGDTRRRGLALLRLKRLYAAAGLPFDAAELPDFLPVVLEFAALAPEGYGEAVLAEHRVGLELLRLRLEELESPWTCLLGVLCAGLPRLGPLERERVRRLLADGPPAEQVGLEPFAPPEVMPEVGARR